MSLVPAGAVLAILLLAAASAGEQRPSGRALLRENGCLACHRMEGEGGPLGPDLTGVGRRLRFEQIDAILKDPRSVDPRASMPAPGLPPPEREALARFLAGVQTADGAPRSRPAR